MDLTDLVVDDGTVTRAQGRVVAQAGNARFEPVGWFATAQDGPRPAGPGVALIGVDTDTLVRRREHEGAIEGYATLAGIWAENALVVSHQAPPGLLPEHHADRPARPEHAWSQATAESAYDELREHMSDWLAYEIGRIETWDGMVVLTAKVVRVLPDLADWARPLPEGMLALDVWLAPHPHTL